MAVCLGIVLYQRGFARLWEKWSKDVVCCWCKPESRLCRNFGEPFCPAISQSNRTSLPFLPWQAGSTPPSMSIQLFLSQDFHLFHKWEIPRWPCRPRSCKHWVSIPAPVFDSKGVGDHFPLDDLAWLVKLLGNDKMNRIFSSVSRGWAKLFYFSLVIS